MSLFSADRVAERLPVTVLTGFLGSGKTTLLNHLLRQPDCTDTAVIINEYGDVPLDHLLVETLEGEIAVLASGCVCCTLRSDLETTLRDLLARRDRATLPPFRRIVIETTGLADPGPILQTLIGNPLLVRFCRLDGVVTVADALHAPQQLARHDEARHQVALADRLLLTKTDLADSHQTAEALRHLRALNAAAPVREAAHGRIAASAILEGGNVSPEERLAQLAQAGDHHYHHHSHGLHSVALTADEPLDWLAVQDWLAALRAHHGPQLLRVKGILDLIGETQPVAVHGVHHVFHEPVRLPYWPERRAQSRLVFILQDLDPQIVAQSFTEMAGIAALPAHIH